MAVWTKSIIFEQIKNDLHLASSKRHTVTLIGRVMYKTSIQEELLDGIDSNIEATENQIYQLHLEFSTVGIGGQRIERRLILQKLQLLEDTLQLLMIRRGYASEVTLH